MSKKTTDKDVLKAKEQFKDMKGREKYEYIWDYYKVHILGSLILLAFVGQFIYVTFINPPLKTGFMISYVNQYIGATDAPREQLKQTISPLVLEDPTRYEIEIIDFVFTEMDPQYQEAMMQKFAAMVTTREIDVIVCNEIDFYGYVELGLFTDLSAIPGLDLTQYKTYLSKSTTNEDTEEHAYGVYVDMDGIMGGTAIESDGILLGIMGNTERPDAAAVLLEEVAEKE